MKHQANPAVAPVSILDTVFNPANFQLRGSAHWQRKQFGVLVGLSYVDGYTDNIRFPSSKVSSWLTADAQFSMQFGAENGSLQSTDWAMSISVQNLLDKDPPSISQAASALGYDPTHASPFGRQIAVRLSKRW